MSTPSTAGQAEPRTPRRSPVLPLAVGAVAIVGGGLTWVIAATGAPPPAGPPELGNPAPVVELQSTSGGAWKLSSFKGREVLMVFFRTHT